MQIGAGSAPHPNVSGKTRLSAYGRHSEGDDIVHALMKIRGSV